jgi:hypothetical protein
MTRTKEGDNGATDGGLGETPCENSGRFPKLNLPCALPSRIARALPVGADTSDVIT